MNLRVSGNYHNEAVLLGFSDWRRYRGGATCIGHQPVR